MCKAVFGNRAVICRYYVLTMKVPDWVESGSRRRPESRHRRLKAQMAGLHSEPAICLLEANVRFGRRARIGNSAAFEVEQLFEHQMLGANDSPVVADC